MANIIEIGQLAEIEDFTPVYNIGTNLGRNPSSEKFKSVFATIYGKSTPARNAKLLIRDNKGNVFFVFYNKNHNEVYFEKLAVRSMD